MSDTKLRVRKATSLLREDHHRLKKLFSNYDALEDDAFNEKGDLFQAISQELILHAQIEEEVFYPEMAKIEDETIREAVKAARAEHEIIKTLLGELSELTLDDETFDLNMKILSESVNEHEDGEEKTLFKAFDKLPRHQQDEISDRVRALKEDLSEGESELI